MGKLSGNGKNPEERNDFPPCFHFRDGDVATSEKDFRQKKRILRSAVIPAHSEDAFRGE